MCGIAGFSGRFPEPLLGEMNARLAHRGPDDSGEYLDRLSGLGLAHRRLAIIDVSKRGRQPMWDATDTACIVFNGEIYNYRELRRDLVAAGVEFRSGTDTEVLLNLYLRHGDRALGLLNGMFAFAIWDTRDRSLLLARDGIGVKPLYYAETAVGFLFASELKALLCSAAVKRPLDTQAIRHYLTYLWCPAPRTMLESVKKLQPGAAMRVREGRVVERWTHYHLPFDQPVQSMSMPEAAASVREHVQQAVRRQLVSDVPLGAMLSGGLDSSSIVACARSQGESPDCFTIGFRDQAFEQEGTAADLPYAQRVARHLDVKLRTLYSTPDAVAGEVERMIYALDEPQADFAAIHTFFICQLAREHGIKVLLSGTGGDDIFSGYRRHRALLAERWWSWLPRPARRGLRPLTSRLPSSPAIGRRIRKALAYADRDGDARLVGYFQWIEDELVASLFSNPPAAERPLVQSLAALPNDTALLNRMLYLDCRHFVPDHNLNYLDKMSMATGVEVRVPLLDPDLVALAARLPIACKHHRGVGKRALRAAMAPLLPPGIIHRAKSGFGAPVRHWLHNALRPLVEDALSVHSMGRRGLFDPASVRQLVALDRSGKVDAAYTLLALVCVELWCRTFLDRRS